MKNDRILEQILAALQESQPALKEEAAAKLTSSILAGITNKKQLTNANGSLLSIAKSLMAAAAVLLVSMFLYQNAVDHPGNHQSGIVYNSYYKETIRNYGCLPQTNSISVLLDYYRQYKKGKNALTLLREQYNPMAKK
ncbi:hypothetical protein A3860_37710 [Niastella vici]|uniref:Uncharacterized protein n=1 Tax=Niastella vici TaxID=1703345 RepID=A0A1V9FM60_9BACT|nr:hypothetical protein [Niastella vici]OQP59397.1 hypothetical protein A3860_37710 [Niastella vici]